MANGVARLCRERVIDPRADVMNGDDSLAHGTEGKGNAFGDAVPIARQADVAGYCLFRDVKNSGDFPVCLASGGPQQAVALAISQCPTPRFAKHGAG